MKTKLIIKAEPVAQGRPRFANRGSFVSTYDPPKSKQYKALVKQQIQQQFKQEPFNKAIRLHVVFYRPIQKSGTKKQLAAKISGQLRPTVKPDLDNYFKAITDAMNGLVYTDDNLICEVRMAKYYALEPRTEIEIEELDRGSYTSEPSQSIN